MAQLIDSGAADSCADRPRAFVYRGPNDDPDLSEAVGKLLKSSPRHFDVQYVGPKNITAASLKTVQLIAFPGGPGMSLSVVLPMRANASFFFFSKKAMLSTPSTSLPLCSPNCIICTVQNGPQRQESGVCGSFPHLKELVSTYCR